MMVWKRKVSLTNELIIELTKSLVTIKEYSVSTRRDISQKSYELPLFAKSLEIQNHLESIIDKKNLQNLIIEVLKVNDLKKEPTNQTTILFSEWDLFYACESGNSELIKQAIKAGVSINSKDPNGNNALFYAVSAFPGYESFVYGSDMKKIVKTLMQFGINFQDKNLEGETVIDRVWAQVNNQSEAEHAKTFEVDVKGN